MVEALAEHLHLHDAIELAAAQIGKNGVLLVSIHFTVYFGRLQAPFLIQTAHLAGMVDGTRDGDDLVAETTALSQLLQILDAGIDDVAIALGRQRDTPPEPGMFPQRHHLFQGVPFRVVAIGEGQL